MRVLLTMFLVFVLSAISFGQDKMARLQVIHNAADPAAEVVDVYVNGKILLDDFKFRAATPFIDVPAEVELNLGVAPASSEDSSDIIANFPVTLANGGTYVVVANGILGDGFAPNPDGREIQFKLFARDNVKEKGVFSFLVDALILHGATDAPAVDILVSFDKSYKDNSSSLAASMDLPQIETFWGYKWLLANDISYGDFKGYKRLLPTKFILDITPAEDNLSIVASFKADLSGLGGGAAVVFASGFLTPDANNDGPAFGLFAALPNGAVVELPMIPMEKPMARLQVIHNAADPAAKMVDVYVNGKRLLDDFKFRAATPFIDVPAEVELKIGVAPADSKDAGDIIATFPVTLADGGSYIAVANGVLGDGFAPNPDGKNIAFTLFATDGAREAAMESGKVDLNVLHGSTDAPTVDVIARDVAKLVDDAMYGDFTGYITVMPGAYILDITPGNDNETVVASFNADLSGLGGGAAVVFASGFLTPDANNDGPAFGLFAALPNGAVVELPMIPMEKPMARLQVIHNAADPAAKMVDVYVNGKRLLDDFKFRAATPFIDVPAEVELKIGVAPADSKDAGDIIATFPVTLADGGSYIAVANGVLGDGFAPNPDGKNIAFTLFATDGAREAAMESGKVDLNVLHGSTDAPTVDVIARDVAKLVDDAMYGDFTGYITVMPGAYILDITPGNDNETVVASFNADLSGLGGGAAVVFASGFLTPDANNDGPAFGLFAALPNGAVVELPMIPMEKPMARLQVIHNAADPAAKMVDVYVNGKRLLDDFKFRAATPFIDVPAEVELKIGVAPADSKDAGDIIATFPVTLADGGSYIAVANGVLGDGFAPNPDGKNIAFTLFATDGAREAAMESGKVDLNVLHGSTDAPTVDVIARDVAKLVDDAMYGDFTGYITVMPGAYILDITPGNDNETVVASFNADLSGLGGGAAVVFASGFLTPDANNDGPAFGLFAALPNGAVVELPMIPMEKPMARLQVIHNAADPAAKMVDVYVNGKRLLDDFKFRAATPFIDVPAEVELKIGVAPADSKDAGDIIATFPVTLADGGSYIAVANGVLGDGFAPNPDGKNIAFTLFATDGAREAAMEDDMVDIKVLHGATDAQGVNILGYGIVIKNAMYGDITDYVSVKARKNWLVVYVPKPSLSLVGVYKADLSGLGGGAAFVFASGFINPDANNNGPSFGLYAALPNGEVVELPELFSNDRMDIMNDIMLSNGFEEITSINGFDNNTVISDYQLQQNYPNPFNPSTKIRFSLPEAANVSLKIYDLTGRLIANLVDGMKSAGQHEIDYNASDLASGIYLYILQAGDFSQIKRMTLLK